MKNKLLKPASFLLYFLSLIVFFLGGMFYARFMDVAKGQGLAGGAIVLSYGLGFAFIALIIAFYIANNAAHKMVVLANKILFGVLVVLMIWFVSLLKSQNNNGNLGFNNEVIYKVEMLALSD